MFSNKTSILAIIIIIALAASLSGCIGGSSNPTATNLPAGGVTSTPTSTAPTATPAASMAKNTYKITTEGKNLKITGNGVVKTETFKLPENWYTVTETYFGPGNYFEMQLMNNPSSKAYSSVMDQPTTYKYVNDLHYPLTMKEDTTDTFYLETLAPTSGDWSIEYMAPPAQGDVKTAPQTYSGVGPAVVGPFKLGAPNGKMKVDYSGPAQSFHVGFMWKDVNYPDYPGFYIPWDQYDVANDRNGKPETPFTKTIDLDVNEDGMMAMLEVRGAADAKWTITITPA